MSFIRNYGNIIISKKEYENRYDKHSVYNPENCEATAPESPEINTKAVILLKSNHYD